MVGTGLRLLNCPCPYGPAFHPDSTRLEEPPYSPPRIPVPMSSLMRKLGFWQLADRLIAQLQNVLVLVRVRVQSCNDYFMIQRRLVLMTLRLAVKISLSF